MTPGQGIALVLAMLVIAVCATRVIATEVRKVRRSVLYLRRALHRHRRRVPRLVSREDFC